MSTSLDVAINSSAAAVLFAFYIQHKRLQHDCCAHTHSPWLVVAIVIYTTHTARENFENVNVPSAIMSLKRWWRAWRHQINGMIDGKAIMEVIVVWGGAAIAVKVAAAAAPEKFFGFCAVDGQIVKLLKTAATEMVKR